MSAIFLLIVAFGIAAPSPAYADSGYVSLKDALAASETIAIARVVDLPRLLPLVHVADGRVTPTKATLDLVQVLKGNLKLGKQEVRIEEYPSGAIGQFIVFLDKNRVWKFTAGPKPPGKRIESDVLTMLGCNDGDDGWFVEPGLITLEQIKTYLKDGSLRYSIEGPIWFPQRFKPTWKASAIRLKLTYDALKKETHVTGLPKLVGFASEPTVSIDYARRVSLEYLNDSDRSLRSPQLNGRVESLDPKSGSMLARFVVETPDALNAETLQKYLADAQLGPCYYKLRLHCARSQQYPKLKDLVLTVDPSRVPYKTLDGWDGVLLEVIATAYDGPQFHEGVSNRKIPAVIGKAFAADWGFRVLVPANANQYLMLGFDIGQPRKASNIFEGIFKDRLLYSVYSAPTRGSLQLYDGKTWHHLTTFTVDLDPVAFGPPP